MDVFYLYNYKKSDSYIYNQFVCVIAADQLERMDNVTVSLDGRKTVWTISGKPTHVRIDIRLQSPQSGHEVTLTRQSSNGNVPFLNICEVQVWGE